MVLTNRSCQWGRVNYGRTCVDGGNLPPCLLVAMRGPHFLRTYSAAGYQTDGGGAPTNLHLEKIKASKEHIATAQTRCQARHAVPQVLRKYIMGGHVAEYMEQMKEEEPEKFQAHFSQYIKQGLEADDLEDLYTKVSE